MASSLGNDPMVTMEEPIVEVIQMQDVTIGPDGRDPSVLLPRMLNFLMDEDVYRHPGWNENLEKISGYVEEANAARLRGELGYDSPHVVAQLEEALIMIKVHREFKKWKDEPNPWSSHTLKSQPTSRRLPNFPNHIIRPKPDKSRFKRRRFDYMPREIQVQLPFPALSARGNELVDYFRLAEELLFEKVINPESAVDSVFNGFELDNYQYERCLKGGISETRRLAPRRLPDDVPAFTLGNTEDIDTSIPSKTLDDLTEFSKSRGWQRAAIQQCLNMFTNHENRVINTPWRRVVFPLKEPAPVPKDIVFHPRALSADRVTHSQKEPFGWVHFYNQYRELMDVLAGWQRRRHNLLNWSDFRRSALPMNFRGPLTYRGLSIYDDYWIRMGSYLRRLHKLLQETFGMAPRGFLFAILRDIQAGIEWRPNKPPTRRADRVDIMRRPEIDYAKNSFGEWTYQLLDEADAAWLRFLCQPSRTPEMCDFEKRPEDNLSIIFDNRLQDFLFNPNACPSPGSAALGDIFDPNLHQFAETSARLQPTLEQARAYINGGGGAAQSHANETYQFTKAEAEHYLRKLSALNRCRQRPHFDEYQSDSEVEEILTRVQGPTTVVRPNYEFHPEHRILWRHENEEVFQTNQREYRAYVLAHLINAYELDKLTDVTADHFEYIFDHFRNHSLAELLAQIKLPTNVNAPDLNEVLYRYIQDELRYQRGSYPEGGLEEKRGAPSWSDLMDWDALPRAYEGTKDVEIPVPERTSQFLRNLAFRMGQTIAHAEEIERRLRYSASNNVYGSEGESERWKPISRAAFTQGYQHWWQSITYGVGDIELKPPTLQAVIDKADPDKVLQSELNVKDMADVDIVREGLINDCVENRNTMYPSRLTVLEDSSGYYLGNEDYKPDKVLVGYKRPSLFKWATTAQRRFQAPYSRRSFFSMTRWPLYHQSEDTQKLIKAREDEALRKNPRSVGQKYGILTARIPDYEEKRTFEGPTAYPSVAQVSVPRGSGLGGSVPQNPKTKDTPSDPSTKDPKGSKAAEGTKQPQGTKGLPDIKGPVTTKPLVGTSTQKDPAAASEDIIQPSTQETLETQHTESASEIRGPSNMSANKTTTETAPAPAATSQEKMTEHVKRNLVPITRPTQKFVPGPAVFPMAETVLQQWLLSESLEQALYPQPEPSFMQKVIRKYKDMTEVGEPEVPLLPSAKVWEIPRSTSRKRKIPAEFITRAAAEEAKKRKLSATKQHTEQPAPSGETAPAPPPGLTEEVATTEQPRKSTTPKLQPAKSPTPKEHPAPGSRLPTPTETPGKPTGPLTPKTQQRSSRHWDPRHTKQPLQPAGQPERPFKSSRTPPKPPADPLQLQTPQTQSTSRGISAPSKAPAPSPGKSVRFATQQNIENSEFAGEDFKENKDWEPMESRKGLKGALHAMADTVAGDDTEPIYPPTTYWELLRAWLDEDCTYTYNQKISDPLRLTLEQANAALQFLYPPEVEVWMQLGCIYKYQDPGTKEDRWDVILINSPHAGDVNNYVIWIYCDSPDSFSGIRRPVPQD
ncbi:hypothetical protein F5Y06DRAFT_303267 [Hypoxylon sp. FL0890]|nr:hypothetical protein F5Y06DRAFT_303267 [Hypoxylon sp. FL0890]